MLQQKIRQCLKVRGKNQHMRERGIPLQLITAHEGLPLHIDTTTEIAGCAAVIVYGSGLFALPDLDFMFLQTGSRHL